MSKLLLILYTALIIGCCLSSCEYDFDVKIPVERKLVAQCNFSPKENFVVFLSTNNTVSDTTDRTFFPRNAEIKLFENDKYIENLKFVDEFNAIYYRSNMIPEANNKYSIKASLENYDSIYSEDIIPGLIDIDNVVVSSINQKPEGTIHWMNVEVGMDIEINAPNMEEKFFHLILDKKYLFLDPFTGDTIPLAAENFDLPIRVPELSFESMTHESGILFRGSDLKAMGNQFQIITPFIFDTLYDVRSPIILELRNVSEDYYLFHKSMSAQNVLSFQQNLLSNQAIRIYNNIENGLGNFSAFHISKDSVRWYE